MTFDVAFKKLKEKFENVDVSILEDMAIQITLSDEDCGGTFYAEVRDHVLSVEPYDYKDNDAVIDTTRLALVSVLDAKTTIDKEIDNGDMSIMGNLEKIAAIKTAIKTPVKKTAAKAPVKATAKKAAEKAPAKKAAEKETKTAAPVKAVKKTATTKTTKK